MKLLSKFFCSQRLIKGMLDQEQYSLSYSKILEGNKKFVESKVALDPQYFINLAKEQHPEMLLIGCADSRVPPNELTGTAPGQMFIHRNIANQVIITDMNLNACIQFAVEQLKVQHIVILGHSQCGGVRAALSNDPKGTFLDCWINQIKQVYDQNHKNFEGLSEDEKLDELVKLNIKEGIKNIWKNPIVQQAWSNGQPVWIHGWLARIETGFIEEIEIDQMMPHSLDIFKFNYQKQMQQVKFDHDKHHHHHHQQKN